MSVSALYREISRLAPTFEEEAPCYRMVYDVVRSLPTDLLALRQDIWRKVEASWQVCGIPEVLYTDNGSDFTSQHLEHTTAELKIRLIFSTPGVPRGRGRIERFFSTLTQLFLCTLSGYAPAGGAVKGKPVLKLAELDSLLRRFLLEDYHRRRE